MKAKFATWIVGLLVLIELFSVFILWTINAVSKSGEGEFAIFLAIDLVSLAMISNIYRNYKEGGKLSAGFVITGFGLILVFALASLALF